MKDRLTKWVLAHTPARLHHSLVNIKNVFFGGYAHTHYAQFGEDVLIDALIKKKDGFYVDVGANHPKRYSNTALLYKRGWRGINIDANPASTSLFRHARERDIMVEAGVAKEKATLPFYQFSDPAMNTFSAEVAEQLKGKKWLHFLGAQNIQVLPLSVILDEHLPPHTDIDVLTIDVEGMDMEVLESNDWNTYIPLCIVIEAHDFNPDTPQAHPIYQFLTAKGYRLRGLLGPSLIFMRF